MFQGSWQNKAIAIGAIVLGALAVGYADSPTTFIFGLSAFKFFAMLQTTFNSVGVFLSRRDNVSSEQAGAGVIPPSTTGKTL